MITAICLIGDMQEVDGDIFISNLEKAMVFTGTDVKDIRNQAHVCSWKGTGKRFVFPHQYLGDIRFETHGIASLPETDIFEVYGLRAKHYDALITKSRQEGLNPDEQAFVEAFGVLLTADDEDRDEAEADMLATHRAWMDADNG